jgi:hypothetical protein
VVGVFALVLQTAPSPAAPATPKNTAAASSTGTATMNARAEGRSTRELGTAVSESARSTQI